VATPCVVFDREGALHLLGNAVDASVAYAQGPIRANPAVHNSEHSGMGQEQLPDSQDEGIGNGLLGLGEATVRSQGRQPPLGSGW
jgi:hypothetical protein